jgi:hypothetical protein
MNIRWEFQGRTDQELLEEIPVDSLRRVPTALQLEEEFAASLLVQTDVPPNCSSNDVVEERIPGLSLSALWTRLLLVGTLGCVQTSSRTIPDAACAQSMCMPPSNARGNRNSISIWIDGLIQFYGQVRAPKRPYKCKLYWEPTAAAESAENNENREVETTAKTLRGTTYPYATNTCDACDH